ncbi:MAG: hypothetical protein ABIP71_02820, partial [Verrucomicrobiota bacterium]
MRIIGYLEDEQAARHFGDFLYVNGMRTTVERDQQKWVVWVHDDDHLQQAGVWLEKFRVNPAAPEFAVAAHADEKRKQEEKDLAKFQKKMQKGRDVVRKVGFYGVGQLTIALMAISIAVAVFSRLGGNTSSIMGLFITKWEI